MALSEAGLTVSPNALRLAMNEKSRDLKNILGRGWLNESRDEKYRELR
jgi:hypothetical protein